MSVMLADIDATCASLGYHDGKNYIPEPDALQGLKVRSLFIALIQLNQPNDDCFCFSSAFDLGSSS